MLLHSEAEVEYPETQVLETHKATLLEFGKTENGKPVTAMALTVGIPAAIGALASLSSPGFSLFPRLTEKKKIKSSSRTSSLSGFCSYYSKTRSRRGAS